MSIRMRKNRLRLISGAMALIMSFYGALPVGAAGPALVSASTNTESQAVAEENTPEVPSSDSMQSQADEMLPSSTAESTEAASSEVFSETTEAILPDSTAESSQANSQPQETENMGPVLYQDGIIYLYDFDQLNKIGSGAPVWDDAASAEYRDAAGNVVCYAQDAQYCIANEIELPAGMVWQLPEGFAGRIDAQSVDAASKPLYDEQTDTIYIYHPYQLAAMSMADASQQPVLTGDAEAESFGTG